MVDDHKMIIEGVMQILHKYEDIHICGFSLDGKSALEESQNFSDIDIFIVDINLPDMDGLIVSKSLQLHFPYSRILILSMHNNRTIIRNAFQRGIMGYVLKNSGEEELVEAIRTVYDGKKFISKDAMTNLIDCLNDDEIFIEHTILSDREVTVAKLASKGMTATEIADILFISPRTVETHRRNIMHKLCLKNASELVKYAINNGWINNEAQ
jgi:DNA-binding NarL/FixJ family response regulator